MESWDAVNHANKAGETWHVGRLHELCFEKNDELTPDKRKWKGRVVFLGDDVRTQKFEVAVFWHLSQPP